MAKKCLTRQKDAKNVREVLQGLSKTLPKETLAEVLHAFLLSIANEILQNHNFSMILKISMNPKHSETPLRGAASSFRTCDKLSKAKMAQGC